MTADAEAILREALALPDENRADVAARLLASLDALAADDPATVRTLWGQELKRREKRVLSGEAIGEDWPSRSSTPRRRIGWVSRQVRFTPEASAELEDAVRW